MPTSEPLPVEPDTLTPTFANGDHSADLTWRQTRLRALVAVRSQDWPAAWTGFQKALSEIHDPADAPLAVGLHADLSHTDWLSGHHAQALQGFTTTLNKAAALEESLAQRQVMAVIALVLAGLNQDLAGEQRPEGERLWPGACSDPAYWPDEPTPTALTWLQLLRLEERRGRSDLFREYGSITADDSNPLIRWYHQQLAIRKLVRDDDPAAILSHVLLCARAYRAVIESPDAGSSTHADRPEPLAVEILATTALPPLLASLILQQGGINLVAMLEGWSREAAAEPELQRWLQGALAIMRQSPDQAWSLMIDPEQALDARLLAGLRALSAGPTLDRLFLMQCLVVIWAAQSGSSLSANLLEAWYPEMVREAWRLMGAAHPDLQARPETAETLLQVCLKPASGWAGVRQMLQTVQPAVNVSLSLSVLDAFQVLMGEPTPATPAETAESPTTDHET